MGYIIFEKEDRQSFIVTSEILESVLAILNKARPLTVAAHLQFYVNHMELGICENCLHDSIQNIIVLCMPID